MSIECSICRGLMVLCQNDETHDTISATRCGHTFHSLCLQRCLAISMTCPKCCLAIKKSHITNKLHFDVFTTGQHDLANIEEERDSLKMTMNEKDAEIGLLMMSIARSNHEYELAKFQRTFMKSIETNMLLEAKELYSTFNSVIKGTIKETSIWREAAVSRGKWIGAMGDMDALWEETSAKVEKKFVNWDEMSAALQEKLTDNDSTPWDSSVLMMHVSNQQLKLRLDEIEDCRVRLFGELTKGEVLLKTTTDRHLAEMEQAKQLQQTSQRELDYLKAEMKTRNTPKWVSGTSHSLEELNVKSSTMGSSEIAGNFQALLQSEKEQHKTEPNAAVICCQNNGATAAMELATNQLKKEIPVREVGQERTLPVKKCRPSRSSRRKKQLQRWSQVQPPTCKS